MAIERWRPFVSMERWDPFRNMNDIQGEVNRLFDSFLGRPTVGKRLGCAELGAGPRHARDQR
jgi:hypothetical protein